MSSKHPERGATYEVGYRKPPIATRFGNRPQPDRSKTRTPKADGGIGSLIDSPVLVERSGKRERLHPVEAELISLANAVLKKKRLSAAKRFLRECQKAELLKPQPSRRTSGVLVVPETRYDILEFLIGRDLLPPWDADVIARAETEYERDLRVVEELKAEFERGLDKD